MLDLAFKSPTLTRPPQSENSQKIVVAASRVAGSLLRNDRPPRWVAMLLWFGQ